MQNPSYLIVAVVNSSLSGQMLGQPLGRPSRKAVTQFQRADLHGSTQGFAINSRSPTGTARGFARYHGRRATVSVKPAHASHSIGSTAELASNSSDGLSGIAQHDDQTVAINDFARVSQTQTIQFVPLNIGKSYAVSHGIGLPADRPPGRLSVQRWNLYESFCVST